MAVVRYPCGGGSGNRSAPSGGSAAAMRKGKGTHGLPQRSGADPHVTEKLPGPATHDRIPAQAPEFPLTPQGSQPWSAPQPAHPA